MDETARDDLKLLVSRRWDPRVGMGKNQGKYEWALGIVIMVGFLSGCIFRATFLPVLVAYGAIFALMFSWVYTRVWPRIRIERLVNKHDGFLCVWCNYPLTGLDEEGNCPECGCGYKKELCERLYGQAFRKFTPSPQEFGKRESKAWQEAIELREQAIKGATP